MPLTLTSLAFEMNGVIPSRFSCEGKNISPDLIFSKIPEGTKSLAILMEDPDVSHSIHHDGVWDHWIVWNIPPETSALDEGGAALGLMGTNSSGTVSYEGPCPPDGEHRYIFTLYALNALLPLKAGATKAEFIKSTASHIIEKAQLIAVIKNTVNFRCRKIQTTYSRTKNFAQVSWDSISGVLSLPYQPAFSEYSSQFFSITSSMETSHW